MQRAVRDGEVVAVPRPRTHEPLAAHGEGVVVMQARTGTAHEPAVDGGHAAALVQGDEQLLAEAALFVQAGLDGGDLVVIGGSPDFLQEMGGQFGGSDAVRLDDGVRLNAKRAPEVLGHSVRLSAEAAGRGSGRLRIVAQVDYGPDPRDVREFACFEAVANHMPTSAPTSVLCLYDVSRLSADLVRTASCTHASLVEGGRVRPSDSFVDPREFVRALPVPAEPLQASEAVLAVDDAGTLAGLRRALGDELTRRVHDREQREDLHLAISEMAANAFRHGRPPVSARLWADTDRLVCTITDNGRGVDPLHGYWPAHGEDLGRGGMGLWLARKLCDHVDITSDERGTTVRLAAALR